MTEFNKEQEDIEQNTRTRLNTGQRWLVGLNRLSPEFAKTDIEGIENIEGLPKDRPSIVVSTHRTEADIGLAIGAVGKHLPMIVSDISTHSSPKGDLGDKSTYLGKKLFGSDNFRPISYHWEGDKKIPDAFNPMDFDAMANAMQETGKSILMAAHNPKQSEPTPGYGAAYLALLTGAPIVPVSVEVSEKNDSSTPKRSRVIIGKPFQISTDIDVESFQRVMNKHDNGERLDQDELAIFTGFVRSLREQGRIVFDSVNRL